MTKKIPFVFTPYDERLVRYLCERSEKPHDKWDIAAQVIGELIDSGQFDVRTMLPIGDKDDD